MRHDEERPRTSGFLSRGTMPGHWTQVLAEMRTNAFTHLRLDEIRAEAAHLLIVVPSPAVAEACFGQLLAEFADPSGAPGVSGAGATAEAASLQGASVEASSVGTPSVDVIGPEELVAERVPAGTWVFLPHRQDGWTELEETSERLRRALVKDNSTREVGDRLTLIEYGVNLWTWAEPPSSGGDPVCHAGELISWESAWALSLPGEPDEAWDGEIPAGEGSPAGDGSPAGEGSTDSGSAGSGSVSSGPDDAGGSASARPPIYFGLPPVLRTRRWNS